MSGEYFCSLIATGKRGVCQLSSICYPQNKIIFQKK